MARKKKRGRLVVKQSGKRKSLHLDRMRKAKHPGYRISKSGKLYYENRRNRSDKKRYTKKFGWEWI